VEPHVAPLVAIFELNTDLLLNCFMDLSQEEAERRLEGGGNSLLFLGSHLSDSRHFLAGRIERPLANPLSRYLEKARSIEEVHEWPSLEELRAAWVAVSDHLVTALGSLTPDEVARPNAHRFPLPDTSQLGLITFLAQHDSYHVGQAAFLRRQLGKPAMSYARARANASR
jgi:uncharacterized damage-inducible protein DinB